MARRSTSKSTDARPDADTRILVLCGSEDLLKRQQLETLRAALEEAHGRTETFNFDGRTAQLAEVLDELRSYALMVSYKIVLVDYADEFVKTHREALERYAENPVDHATLVLRSTKWNSGNLDKKIARVGQLIKCDAPDARTAKQWLIERAQTVHERKLAPQGADALLRRIGPHLLELDTELAKLALLVDPKQAIDAALVSEVVGRSSDEEAYRVQTALLSAMAEGRGGSTITKLHEVVDLAGQPDVLVSYFVADVMRKLQLASLLSRQGVPENQIARELKIWGPQMRPFFALVRRLQPAATRRLFDRIIELDGRSKSGFGDAMRNLECFCAGLADEGL